MSDQAPLLFTVSPFKTQMKPANQVSEEALKALGAGALVRITIVKARGNVRRNALYWACLGVAVPMLDEKVPGLTVDLLHKVLKDRYGLVRVVTLPSGEQIKDYDSTSFAKMTEPDRAKFIDWALNTVSTWLGCDVTDLRQEAA